MPAVTRSYFNEIIAELADDLRGKANSRVARSLPPIGIEERTTFGHPKQPIEGFRPHGRGGNIVDDIDDSNQF